MKSVRNQLLVKMLSLKMKFSLKSSDFFLIEDRINYRLLSVRIRSTQIHYRTHRDSKKHCDLDRNRSNFRRIARL